MERDGPLEPTDAFDTLSDIVLFVTPKGTLESWNQAVLTTTGLTPEDLTSRGLSAVVDDAEAVRDAVADAAETGAARFDARLKTADGSERIYEFVATPHMTAHEGGPEDVHSLVCVGRDVTETRRRKRELERFEVIVESVPDAVYAIASDGTIHYVNEQYCRMKGASREELVGTDIDDWVLDEEVEKADRMRAAVGRGERDVGVAEYDFVTADGQTFPAELRFGPVDEAETDVARVGMIRDVSSRVERERRLARQNERLEEFASIVSHDLRNPLNVAEGRLALAREECDSDHLDALERAHDRMYTLIESLLTLAKQGQRGLDPSDLSLPDLVTECWQAVSDTDATLVVDTDATVTADETPFCRLLENLFRNAIEHGGSDVNITIGDLPDGFYVADDGPGIPAEDREQIFEAGYSTSEDGTGFGLRIVRDVAEAHGWDVAVTQSDAGGARFEFRGVDTE